MRFLYFLIFSNFYLFVNSASKNLNLPCIFSKESDSVYTCKIFNLTVLNQESFIINVTGNHIVGYTNDNVTKIDIQNTTSISYLPQNFSNFFKNIEILEISSKTIKKIQKRNLIQFTKLKKLNLIKCSINQLYPEMFDGIELEEFNFQRGASNQIFSSIHPELHTKFSLMKRFTFLDGDIYKSYESNGNVSFISVWEFLASNYPYYGTVFCIYQYKSDGHYSCDVLKLMEKKGTSRGNKTIYLDRYGFHKNGNGDINVTEVDVKRCIWTPTFPNFFGRVFLNLKIMKIQGQIERIDKPHMRRFPKVEEFHLQNNNIKVITSDAFVHNHKLRYLNLAGNQLREIGIGAFWVPKNLEFLDIGSSLCMQYKSKVKSDIHDFIKQRLKYSSCVLQDALYCQFVKITLSFVGQAYACIGNNSDFTKQDENLITVNLNTLAFGDHIEGLSNSNVTAMKIKNYPLEKSFDFNITISFPNLEYLQIFNSSVENFSNYTFRNLTDLKVIDLSYNKITVINENYFSNKPNLIYVNLEGNMLKIVMIKFNISPDYMNVRGNLCIDDNAVGVSEVDELIKTLSENCKNE